MNPAAIAAPVEDTQGDGRWMSMHQRFLSETKGEEPDVVFIGDSIIMQLGLSEVWFRWFAPMHALNYGIGGDQTQNVLWRIQNGELDYFKPKVIVLHVGTNNHGHTAQQIAEGILAIHQEIRERQPQCYVVVLTLLPRGHQANPLRERNKSVNLLVKAALASAERTEIVDIDTGFVQLDGSILHHDMYDYLHLTRLGYRKAFEPVNDLLLQLLSEWEKEQDEEISEETSSDMGGGEKGENK